MNVIVIIQARMGSSRLPGKILKPLGSFDVLTYVVERSKKIKGVSKVIVATSLLPQDDVVEEWCKRKDVSYFRGSETDVLSRYVEAAKEYNPEYVIRVTADCPFVDYQLATKMVEKKNETRCDFMSIIGDLPRGLAVELFSYHSLNYMNQHGKEQRHREHVTYYAYEFKEEFSWDTIEACEAIQQPELRITLDTEEDYELCKKIADYYIEDILVPTEKVVKFLKENPEIASINAHIKQKPVV
ncbi:cytidylyltransferase domain-containing protein [Calidifontibacillus oryziterrae]|uniref:cytidylyltransferase domain-containing protein n=1 Tax=Calidifontibacillus oryziterrae TaxID=1191699 RepID=UPI0002F03C2E|nr:glycosyltransferase family protein [Calidifontibacillus oryziterrae]